MKACIIFMRHLDDSIHCWLREGLGALNRNLQFCKTPLHQLRSWKKEKKKTSLKIIFRISFLFILPNTSTSIIIIFFFPETLLFFLKFVVVWLLIYFFLLPNCDSITTTTLERKFGGSLIFTRPLHNPA